LSRDRGQRYLSDIAKCQGNILGQGILSEILKGQGILSETFKGQGILSETFKGQDISSFKCQGYLYKKTIQMSRKPIW